MKRIITKETIFIFIISLLITIGGVIGFTHAIQIPPNQVLDVTPNTIHTYTLTVSYDAISEDISSLNGDTLYYFSYGIDVEDKLPYGLEFVDFVRTTGQTSIRAHRRLNTNECDGYVLNDNNLNDANHYLGVTYNPDNRTFSFRVFHLRAGCDIDIKYKVRVPATDDPLTDLIETERTYHNVIKATYNDYSYYSNFSILDDYNATHAASHQVSYSFEGNVPNGAPILPGGALYVEGSKVDVLPEPFLRDYDFSGWTSNEVTIDNNNQFTMPTSDVHLVGRFIPKQKYTVSYQITGDVPDGYLIPKPKEYVPGTLVDTEIDYTSFYNDEYAVNKWESNDVEIVDNKFVMPNHNVLLKGAFERKEVIVNINYIGTISNQNDYPMFDNLPDVTSYTCGDPAPSQIDLPAEFTDKYEVVKWQKVYLDELFSSTGYELWENYHKDCENYSLYAYFVDKVKLTDVDVFLREKNPKETYQAGETINYEITVKTHRIRADYIVLKIEDSNMVVQPGTGYTLEGSDTIIIEHMAANATFKINATAVMPNNQAALTTKITREIATLPDEFVLTDNNKEAEVTVNRGANLTVCNEVDHPLNDKVFQISLKGENGFETWLNLKNSECKTIDVGLGNFRLFEIKPQEYELTNITGTNNTSGAKAFARLEPGDNRTVTFHNELDNSAFLHGYGSVENTIPSSEMPELQPARSASIVFVSSYETNPGTQYMPDIKFNNSKLDYNVIQYERNRIVDGSYQVPGNCSYTNCPVPEGMTSDPYINHEYHFLGWSTEKQDRDYARGDPIANEVTFNYGVPTNMLLPEDDIIYLYAIYDNYTDNRTCSIAEVIYHDYNDAGSINPLFYFDPEDFENKTYLSEDYRTNTVTYGRCSNDPNPGFRTVLGEYHDMKPLDGSTNFGGWDYNDGHNAYLALNYYVENILGPPEPSNTYYPEMVKFGVDNTTDGFVGNLIRYGIRYNNYVDPHYLRINAYGQGSGCIIC